MVSHYDETEPMSIALRGAAGRLNILLQIHILVSILHVNMYYLGVLFQYTQ
jgi:hypothetical protein